MKLIHRLMVVAAAVALLSTAVEAQPKYIGAAKCKICHKVEYTSWEASKHAKAFGVLKPEEQKDPKCYGCHVTNNDVSMPGVQCEVCHGPGSDYQGLKVMKDPKASRAAGLIDPTQAVCEKCHNSKSPNYKPLKFPDALKKVHDVKPKP